MTFPKILQFSLCHKVPPPEIAGGWLETLALSVLYSCIHASTVIRRRANMMEKSLARISGLMIRGT